MQRPPYPSHHRCYKCRGHLLAAFGPLFFDAVQDQHDDQEDEEDEDQHHEEGDEDHCDVPHFNGVDVEGLEQAEHRISLQVQASEYGVVLGHRVYNRRLRMGGTSRLGLLYICAMYHIPLAINYERNLKKSNS